MSKYFFLNEECRTTDFGLHHLKAVQYSTRDKTTHFSTQITKKVKYISLSVRWKACYSSKSNSLWLNSDGHKNKLCTGAEHQAEHPLHKWII